MLRLTWLLPTLSLSVLWPAAAQTWEAGFAGGGGFPNHAAVMGPGSQATTGPGRGVAASGYIAQHLYPRLSGEIRYTYRASDLELISGGQKAVFSGLSHSVHYGLLVHGAGPKASVRPFAAAGAGIRVYRGTGTEHAYQPLSGYALLTKTQQWKPLVTAGGGVSVALTRRLALRIEARDYITPFPAQVIAPAAGSSIKGWLHDIVPLAGLSVTFE